MGSIEPEIEEWAVVSRLRKLLETSRDNALDVTHPFALFSAVCMWVRWRVGSYESYREWPGGLRMLQQPVTETPWNLSKESACGCAGNIKLFAIGAGAQITLPTCNAWEFVVWIRNAIAHGDHRRIKPLHHIDGTLVGFRIEYGAKAELSGGFMQHFGMTLADLFCTAYRQPQRTGEAC